MKNINKNAIKMSFKILAVLAFMVLITPVKASAYSTYGGQMSPYGSYGSPEYVTAPAYPIYPSYPAPINYYNTTPANPTVVYVPSPSTVQTVAPAPVETVVTEPSTTENKGSYSNLAASAIVGSNNLMPSGIIQWVLFAILILVIVILARKIFGAEKKYHSTPMKHA